MNLPSRGKFRFVAISLLAAVLAIAAFAVFTYRHGRNQYQLEYTKIVKRRDIADTARNAVSALQSAALSAQDYVLTGETIYSEGYAKDVRQWQDESGTLELVAQHDRASAEVRDLASIGTRVLNDLNQTVSAYDSGSRDAALEHIRKGSAFVYMGQVRETLGDIERLNGLGADESDQVFIGDALRVQRRLAAAVAGLVVLTVAGLILLIIEAARGGSTSQRQQSASLQSAAKAS